MLASNAGKLAEDRGYLWGFLYSGAHFFLEIETRDGQYRLPVSDSQHVNGEIVAALLQNTKPPLRVIE